MGSRLSVIIPVFNSERFLEKCLDSVCSQTLKDIEIICVDDCSTDGSLDILYRYRHKDSRIRVFRQETNMGPGAARNRGILESKGEYIGFVDSDDWIDASYLEKMLLAIEAHDTDIVLNCNFENEYDDASKNTSAKYSFIKHEGSFLSARELQVHYPPVIWSRLYRKSFLETHGLTFPNVKGGAEDIFFAYASDLTLGKVYSFKGETYHYYQRSSSAMHTSNRGFHYFESFSLLNNYLKSKDISADDIKLFYVESLILDTEKKYNYVKLYLNSIRDQIQSNVALYNEQEFFLLHILEETSDYAQFLQKYNPNISLSYIRYKMTRR